MDKIMSIMNRMLIKIMILVFQSLEAIHSIIRINTNKIILTIMRWYQSRKKKMLKKAKRMKSMLRI